MATKRLKSSVYTYKGLNKHGEKVTGELDAKTLALAKAETRRLGIMVKKIRKKPKPLFNPQNKKITTADITIFSRQMATMLAAGIPLVQSFDIVGRGHTNPSMQKLASDVKSEVESGTTLAEALGKHPVYFNELFCNLVDAGEQSGSLDVMLNKVATYKEKMESIKAKIKKALFYPAAVLIVAFIVTAALLIYVVPQFESLFKGFGADLPAMTRLVMDMSAFFQENWWLMFGTIGGVIWAFINTHKRSPTFSHRVDEVMLRFPVIGSILEKAAVARFARTLSITFAAGLPLVDALKAVSGATGNYVFTKATLKIREEVTNGQQMQLAMRNTNRFPNMVIQMVAIGEESGALEEMLAKVAGFYEEAVDNAVDSLSSLLEPIIMAILGVLVGGLVIAMYLPIFKLGSAV